MTQEVLKQMYQLLLTEPHAPTVCAQLERIAREALADHAMRETQRLGQEIEQEPVAWMSEHDVGFRKSEFGATPTVPLYTSPPQRKPLTEEQRKDLINKAWNKWLIVKTDNRPFAWHFSFEVEAAHGIKETK